MQTGFDSTLSYVLFVPTQKENMNVRDVPRGDAATAFVWACPGVIVEMKSLKSSSKFGGKAQVQQHVLAD